MAERVLVEQGVCVCCLTGLQGFEGGHTHARVGIIVTAHLHIILERPHLILGCPLQWQRHRGPDCGDERAILWHSSPRSV